MISIKIGGCISEPESEVAELQKEVVATLVATCFNVSCDASGSSMGLLRRYNEANDPGACRYIRRRVMWTMRITGR